MENFFMNSKDQLALQSSLHNSLHNDIGKIIFLTE